VGTRDRNVTGVQTCALPISEQLDRGLIDFGVLIGRPDLSKCDALPLPARDVWGVLMPAGCPLAQKAAVAPEDLWDKPLIVSRQKIGRAACRERGGVTWEERV